MATGGTTLMPATTGFGNSSNSNGGPSSSRRFRYKVSRAQKEKEQQAAQLLEHGDLEKAETIYRSLLEEEIISYAVFEKLSYICYMQDRMK